MKTTFGKSFGKDIDQHLDQHVGTSNKRFFRPTILRPLVVSYDPKNNNISNRPL